MISRFLHIIVSFNLLVSLTGFSVSVHYCGGELMDFAIDKEAKSCCDSSCNSCSNEDHYVKLEEDLSSPVYHQSPDIAKIDLMAPVVLIFDQPLAQSEQFSTFISESPPGRSGPERLSQFQSFLL
ncbi:MAG: hypothetical protein KDC05_10605 [Bacteroidales bacterium]|nr:hypothetical protein [Bacteroidales bacterium]